MSATPETRYQYNLTTNGFIEDLAQKQAVQVLERLYHQLVKPEKKVSFLKRMFYESGSQAPKGVYLWGGVGRGKTWLMDVFYDCLPFENKIRLHFHHFMKHVHEHMSQLKGQQDPLKIVAKQWAKKTKVLCFDELFVSDITDAMLLAGLFEALFQEGVTLVATSNVTPDELYKDGLQRERFLPAIALIKENTRVFNLDNGKDYRLTFFEQTDSYFYPADEASYNKLHHFFRRLSHLSIDAGLSDSFSIEGRSIQCRAYGRGVLWITFAAMCGGPRSQNDYIAIANLFHTVILEGVPVLDQHNDDQARRFISLIDEFYDRRTTLVISAHQPIDSLYQGSRLAFPFERTVSRLKEMQSAQYKAKKNK